MTPRPSANGGEPTNLEGVLDDLERCCADHRGGRVSVHDMLDTIGPRSFGPLILVPGLIGISPIGAIPLVPAVMALIEVFVAAEILLHRQHVWIPQNLARRSTDTARLERALKAIRPYARVVDRFLGPRLTFLTQGFFFYVLALLTLLVALVTPIIEIVPLAGIVPNAALVSYGLAITAHDGLWALIAIAVTVASFYMLGLAIW